METMGAAAFFDEEWESLSKLFTVENPDFMLHQLQGDDGGAGFEAASTFWQAVEASMNVTNAEVSNNGSFPFDHVNQLVQSDDDESMKFFVISQKESDTFSLSSVPVFDPDEVIRDMSDSEQLDNSGSLQDLQQQVERKFEVAEEQAFRDGNPRKRTRVSRDVSSHFTLLYRLYIYLVKFTFGNLKIN